MSSRTRARTVKTAAGVHTVNIPRRRGRRGEQVVIVVPERPTLTRLAASAAGRALWRYRRSLAPAFVALLAVPTTAVFHLLGWWWLSLFFLPFAVIPMVSLAVNRRHPLFGLARLWRAALTATATIASLWVVLASVFGPLTGPLPLLWLLTLIAAQTAWTIVRPRPARSEESI